MEDISKQFNIDKNKGNEFFYEQTKVDEALFLSTILVNQQEINNIHIFFKFHFFFFQFSIGIYF